MWLHTCVTYLASRNLFNAKNYIRQFKPLLTVSHIMRFFRLLLSSAHSLPPSHLGSSFRQAVILRTCKCWLLISMDLASSQASVMLVTIGSGKLNMHDLTLCWSMGWQAFCTCKNLSYSACKVSLAFHWITLCFSAQWPGKLSTCSLSFSALVKSKIKKVII